MRQEFNLCWRRKKLINSIRFGSAQPYEMGPNGSSATASFVFPNNSPSNYKQYVSLIFRNKFFFAHDKRQKNMSDDAGDWMGISYEWKISFGTATLFAFYVFANQTHTKKHESI